MKKMIGKTGSAALCAVLLTVAMHARAGVVFEAEVTHYPSQQRESLQLMVEAGNLKMELGTDSESGFTGEGVSQGRQGREISAESSATASSTTMGDVASAAEGAANSSQSQGGGAHLQPRGPSDYVIFRGDRNTFYMVDHKRREVIDVSSHTQPNASGKADSAEEDAADNPLAALGGLLGNATTEQKEALKDVADLFRQGAAELAKAHAEANREELRKTGEKAIRHGYPCERYEVLRGGVVVQELWITQWQNLTGGEEVRDAFAAIESHVSALSNGYGIASGAMLSVGQADGFPVVTRDFENGELVGEAVLRSASRRELDAEAFEPPKGYRLRTMSPF